MQLVAWQMSHRIADRCFVGGALGVHMPGVLWLQPELQQIIRRHAILEIQLWTKVMLSARCLSDQQFEQQRYRHKKCVKQPCCTLGSEFVLSHVIKSEEVKDMKTIKFWLDTVPRNQV